MRTITDEETGRVYQVYDSTEDTEIVYYKMKKYRPAADCATLPPDRRYRVICVNESDDRLLLLNEFDYYSDAHMLTLDCDSMFDYPDQYYCVERSLDDGKTWHEYDASERIGGHPAWTYRDL